MLLDTGRFSVHPSQSPLKTETSLKRLFEARKIANDGAIFAP